MNKNVLVTSIGSFSGRAVIKALKNMGYHVTGCNCYPREWVVNSKLVDRYYEVPHTAEKSFPEHLAHICEKEQINMIVPLTDVDVDWLAEHIELEAEWNCIFCQSAPNTIKKCRDKRKTADLCDGLPVKKIPCLDVKELDKGLLFPIVCKPTHGRSSEGLFLIRNNKDLDYYRDKLNSDYLIQPFIEGHVYCADTIRNPEDQSCVVVAREELLRTHNGAGLTVHVKREEEIETACAALAHKLDIRGCVNFEFIRNSKGELYLLECNPRFSGGIEFTCCAGYNMIKNHMHLFDGKREIDAFQLKRDFYMGKEYETYVQ